MDDVFAYIDANRERYVEALRRFVRQPSVTTDLDDCERCADVLERLMADAGCTADRSRPAPGIPPVLYHEAPAGDPGSARTLLGYAHYDVKPADPLDAWTHDPWGGEVVEGVMYGRGVVDNKSGCLAFMYALEAFRALRGTPPVNVKLVFEGEEETGSEHLETWVLEHRDRLEGIDGLHCLDGTVEASTQRPRLNLHGRGMIYVDLVVQGPRTDVHSGRANLVTNPAWRLVGALATIKDPHTDRILIDGWYDDLAPLGPDEEAYLRAELEGFDEVSVQRQFGTEGRPFPGDKRGLDLVAAYHRDPTANINGIHAGYTVPGKMQTIVPSVARAKLDFRCPPELDAGSLVDRLRRHLDDRGFEDVEMQVLNASGYPWRAAYGAAITRACIEASHQVFGTAPGAVGPTAPEGVFAHHFQVPPILTGFGPDDSNIHAPDEKLPIDQYLKGIKYAAAIMHHFATVEEVDYGD
jgi:acetylornithine deacetylase/succinyl-diaminopimelate desuccinylase-like protein